MAIIKNWDQAHIEKMALKIIIQAVRDFAYPKKMDNVKAKYQRLDKSDPMYKENKERLFKRERKKIIKDLKNNELLAVMSSGKSTEIADKLQSVLDDKTGNLMRSLKQNVKKLERKDD